MLKDYELKFERGSILTKEMLGEMYGYARDYLDILYGAYPDGILVGMDVKQDSEGSIWVSKGLAKYEGRIYRMAEDWNLSAYFGHEVEQGRLKQDTKYQLQFVGKRVLQDTAVPKKEKSIWGYALEPDIAKRSEEGKGLHFARFLLNGEKGVDICNVADMENIAAPTFWDMTDCPYATRNSVTFHPYIFRMVRNELEKKKNKTGMDFWLLHQLISQEILDLEWIRLFLQDSGMDIENTARKDMLPKFIEAVMAARPEEVVQKRLNEEEKAPARVKDEGKLLI